MNVGVLFLIAFAMLVCNAKSNAQAAKKSDSPVPIFTNTTPNTVVITTPPNELSGNEATNQTIPIPPPVSIPVLALQKETLQVIQLAQAGLGENVLMAYIGRSTNAFHLTSEDVVYLNDVGISSPVIAAMLAHDSSKASQPQSVNKSIEIDPTGKSNVATPAVPVVQTPPSATLGIPLAAGIEVSTNFIPNATTIPNAPTVANTPPVSYAESTPPQVITALPPQEQVTYQYFHNSLAPYGSWLNIPGYGVCWQPTVASTVVDWRPYGHSGRWLYSDYGWYWHSDYSWGWAPFHYGRWHRPVGYNWCWIPDTTWGPAWVSWRYSDAHCGWAPLPPAAHWRHGYGFSYHDSHVGVGFGFGLSWDYYTVVSYDRMCDRRPFDHHLPRHRAEHFHHNSSVVNVARHEKHGLINHGVPVERVSRASRSEVQRVSVREVPQSAGHPMRHNGANRDGSQLVVYRNTSVSQQTQAADIVRESQHVRSRQHISPTKGTPTSPAALRNSSVTVQSRPSPARTPSGNESIQPVPTRNVGNSQRPETPEVQRPIRTPQPQSQIQVIQNRPFSSRPQATRSEGQRPVVPTQIAPNPIAIKPVLSTPPRPVTTQPTITTVPSARPQNRPTTPAVPSQPQFNFNRPPVVSTPNPRITQPPTAAAQPERSAARSFSPPPANVNRPVISTAPSPRFVSPPSASAPAPAFRAPAPPSAPAVNSNSRQPGSNERSQDKGNERRQPQQR